MWYSFTSPPSTATCATPLMASSRGRMTLSAMVRRSSMEVLSAVSPTMSSSPSMDDCGAMVGVPAPAGRASLMAASFSAAV